MFVSEDTGICSYTALQRYYVAQVLLRRTALINGRYNVGTFSFFLPLETLTEGQK